MPNAMVKYNNNLKVSAKLENLAEISEFIDEATNSVSLDEKSVFNIQLAVEEACTNIINYAYPDGNGDIEIICVSTTEKFVITLIDDGIPFDPTGALKPDTEACLEKRNIGGLGIHLIRNLMDEVMYKREGERNVLTLGVGKVDIKTNY